MVSTVVRSVAQHQSIVTTMMMARTIRLSIVFKTIQVIVMVMLYLCRREAVKKYVTSESDCGSAIERECRTCV
jgi:hypothetical protein